ncbi:MAG: hypothetical protein ABIA74_02410 [bacterium]
MKMKKILLTVVVAAVSFGNAVFAFDYDMDEMNENEKVAWFWTKKDEDKAKVKQEKKEKKQTAKAEKKAEKTKEKKTKKVQKEKKKEKKQKKQEVKKEKKVEKKQVKKVKKEKKKEAKVEKGETCPLKYTDEDAVDKYVAIWEEDLANYQSDSRTQRNNLIAAWKQNRKMAVDKEYTDGKYADLYKLPTWPFEALFAEHSSLLNVKEVFTYQTSAYGSNGTKFDLSKNIFGEDPVRLRDILLAFKLIANCVVDDNNLDDILSYGSILSLGWLPENDYINLIAESDEYRTSINYSRYIVDDQVLIGFEIPVVYKKHYLKTSFYKYELGKDEHHTALNLFLVEGSFQTAFEKVLNLKDLNYNQKHSVTGLGDINLFMNCNIRSRFFEKANWGFKLQLPTSKDPDKTKLWAPELGEEFVKFSLHAAMLWGIRDWFNPHFLIQGTYAASANVDRRIPRKIKHTASATHDADFKADDMLLGQYVKENEHSTFAEWDTTVKGMADESRKVSLQPGPEIFVRIGNIFEKVLFRRAFLDLYYDFRAKFEDSASGLAEDDYNLRLIEQGTNQIENNIGLNLSYQFDYHTRLQLGGRYGFAGRNVPQNMQLSCNLGIEF